MSHALLDKMERIEILLLELNSKIDDFLGFEDLDSEEKQEIDSLRKKVVSGNYVAFEDAFGG